MRNMLVVDSAYNYHELKTRNLEEFVLSRDQGDFFANILTVHPFAGVQFPDDWVKSQLYGNPQSYSIDDKNTFIEGKRGRFASLEKWEILNYALSLVSILKLVFLFQKKHKITVVRAEDALLNGFIAWMLSLILRKPLIIGVWGNSDAIRKQTNLPLMPRFFKSKLTEKKWETFILNRAEMILVGNLDNYNFVSAHGIKSSKLRVLPVVFNLSPAHLVHPSKRLPFEDCLVEMNLQDQNLIACISRLEKVKLVDHAIRALQYINPELPEFRLLVVGDGSQCAELKSLCIELGIEKKVIFCGNQNQDWISRLIARVDVIISPITGRALAECAIGGAAIVAYDIDWQRELIQTGRTGQLIPYLDYEAMGKAVSDFLEDSNYRLAMGRAVRKEILQKMSSIDISSSMNSIYDEIEKQSNK